MVCNFFEFLAMVADRKAVKERCGRTEETELLHLVGRALELHQKEKSVQRAGLQLYEAILNNATEKGQRAFAKKIFRAVGENLQRNNDDPAICYTSYSILCTLTDKMGDKLAPWVDRILGLILTTVSQLFSMQLVAKCMVLLELMAKDQESLHVMAAHPRCLLVFTDALGILDAQYLSASITALEYLLRILEDETAIHIVAENLQHQQQHLGTYFAQVQGELAAKAERFAQQVAEAGEGVDDGAMQYWLQLLDAATAILSELERDNGGDQAPSSETAVEAGLLEVQIDGTGGRTDPALSGVNPVARAGETASMAVMAGEEQAPSVGVVFWPGASKSVLSAAPPVQQEGVIAVAQAVSAEPDSGSHKKRSFIYEQPGQVIEAEGGSGKERVVGANFDSLATLSATASPPSDTTAVTAPAAAMSRADQMALAAGIKWENLMEQTEVSLSLSLLLCNAHCFMHFLLV